MLAVMARYFPSPSGSNNSGSGYCSNPAVYEAVTQREAALVPADLLQQLDHTGRVPASGDVKYIFLTKPGPGPVKQDLSESLLNSQTGELNPVSQKHKRLQIGKSSPSKVSQKLTQPSSILSMVDGFIVGAIVTASIGYFLFKLKR